MYYNVTSRIFSKDPESHPQMHFSFSSHIQKKKSVKERSKGRKERKKRKKKNFKPFVDPVLKPKIHRVSALPPQM